ncbi:MAG: GNAT family N-acetyltransferase, partial [Anaeroplasmataceae bacterium]|nr:GNAT family N-acetyltransferase [Anaeroplasmataceae bacterium]
MIEYKDCTKEIAMSLNSWLADEKIIKYAMFDSSFIDEYLYYQDNTYEEKIKDVLKVVYVDGILMGYVVLNYYSYDSIFEVGINPFIVNPHYQNQGFGKKILSDLTIQIENLVQGKVDQIYATIEKTNLYSIHLFESVGFIQKEEHENFLNYYF